MAQLSHDVLGAEWEGLVARMARWPHALLARRPTGLSNSSWRFMASVKMCNSSWQGALACCPQRQES